MRFAVLVFPGTWSDHDCQYCLRDVLGQDADLVWHRQHDLSDYDCIVLPGGFSYGDYLRAGAIARFSPAMEAVVRHAEAGKPVIGICNGFQVLCEAQLLPGVLRRNQSLQYRCQWLHIRVDNVDTPFTLACRQGAGLPGPSVGRPVGPARRVLAMPISHGEGCYHADEETLSVLESSGRVVFRYCTAEGEVTAAANPNGSVANIAGICNQRGNVLGMMPHPERACEPLMGGEDGLLLWRSLLAWVRVRA